MTRLRLWLARLLLPRGWGVVPVEPGRVYRAVEAGESLPAGICIGALVDDDGRGAALMMLRAWQERMAPHADTLGQDDLAPPTL